METKLSNTERQALAREAAADKYGYRNDQWQQSRTVFHQGWDAALEWIEEERIRSCTADMEIDIGG